MSIVEGSWGIVMPAATGSRYKYVFYPFEFPQAGDKVLVYPSHSGKYYLLKLATNARPGQKIIVVSDNKGNHWGVVGE